MKSEADRYVDALLSQFTLEEILERNGVTEEYVLGLLLEDGLIKVYEEYEVEEEL